MIVVTTRLMLAARSLMTDSFELIEPVDSASCRIVWSMPARLCWPVVAMRDVWLATWLTSFIVFRSSWLVAEISLTAAAAWFVEVL